MQTLNKLKKGDKVAILSPSTGAPAIWPHVYDLGIKRLKDIFALIPIEYPTTKTLNAAESDKIKDIEDAFNDRSIKGIITTLGGQHQKKYVNLIDPKIISSNPKPFFGFSDSTHLANYLWINGIPCFYGGGLFTQFAFESEMDPYTIHYLNLALFEKGKFELLPSDRFNDQSLDWHDPSNLSKRRLFQENEGWFWTSGESVIGITWGGCLESLDEILTNNIQIPDLVEFESIILMTETSEEVPSAEYCASVYLKLGEKGILERVKGVLVGRPQSWNFESKLSIEDQKKYRELQREAIIKVIRSYNKTCSIVQNLDFGHTNPQIPMPYGGKVQIDCQNKKIFAWF